MFKLHRYVNALLRLYVILISRIPGAFIGKVLMAGAEAMQRKALNGRLTRCTGQKVKT